MFQSLFYWKYHFNKKERFGDFKNKKVSILILLEVPLQQNEVIFTEAGIRVFQSLFYWKYHFNFISNGYILPLLQVSILILLEVPLQQHFMAGIVTTSDSFNPYFTGSTTSTRDSR